MLYVCKNGMIGKGAEPKKKGRDKEVPLTLALNKEIKIALMFHLS